MTRNPATLAQTIRRRILLTGGSGELSTIFAGGVFATGGSDGFVGAAVAGGAPAATVSPGVAGVEVLLADNSSLAEVSTRQTLRQAGYTLQRCIRVKIIQLPALQGSLSAQEHVIRLYMKSTEPNQNAYERGAVGTYTLFFNLLARNF